MELVRVRMKYTGQVIDMVPAVAQALIDGGTAELYEEEEKPGVLTAAVNKINEVAMKARALPRTVMNRTAAKRA